MIVIGSEALRMLGHEIRKPGDIDLIATPEEFITLVKSLKPKKMIKIEDAFNEHYALFGPGYICEVEIAFDGTTGAELLGPAESQFIIDGVTFPVSVASIDVLLSLKMSHRYKKNSKFFLKTMRDIRFLRSIGAKVHSKKWLKARQKETLAYKHPKLVKESKDDFFSAAHGVNYVYDHDSIHEAVKHMEKPAYCYYQPEGAAVETSKSMFQNCDENVRLLGVLEEAYVLSLERAIIPHNLWEDMAKQTTAFQTALMKVCTSITSGWFREFAWENYETVLGMYNRDYINKFVTAREQGQVLPYTGSTY